MEIKICPPKKNQVLQQTRVLCLTTFFTMQNTYFPTRNLLILMPKAIKQERKLHIPSKTTMRNYKKQHEPRSSHNETPKAR